MLGRVAHGESDLVLTLFTERLGRVSTIARGARRSRKRFAGALEPMHTLMVRLDERPRAELLVLNESILKTPRVRLMSDLERMQAAGRALAWVRRAAPPRTPEPEVWCALVDLLDRLDRSDRPSELDLAETGLSLLAAFGWGLDLQRCVRCSRACEPGRPALVDAARGGLVCRACGGARLRVEGAVRERLRRAQASETDVLIASDAEIALEILESALRAHA